MAGCDFWVNFPCTNFYRPDDTPWEGGINMQKLDRSFQTYIGIYGRLPEQVADGAVHDEDVPPKHL